LRVSKDGWGAAAVLAASVALFAATLGLRDNPLVPIGPGFYPRIVLGITAVLALWVFLAELLSPRTVATGQLNYSLVVTLFAVFGLYCAALPYVGFRLSTFAYVAATNALLDVPKAPRGWGRVALIALVTTAVVYYVFERYLLVLLPRGRWIDF
jgi:putative tricarboxylic transport membrane protein